MTSSEVELGCHSGMDCLAAELFPNSRFSDTVFGTLFRTAVETAVREVHKSLNSYLLNIVVLAVVGGLFGLYRSEFLGALLLGSRPPLWPSLISLVVSVDVKHQERRRRYLVRFISHGEKRFLI